MGINTILNGDKHFDEPKMDEPDTIVKISETYRLGFWRGDIPLLDFVAANFDSTEGDMESTFDLSRPDLDRIIEAFPNDSTFVQAREWLCQVEPNGVKCLVRCLVLRVTY